MIKKVLIANRGEIACRIARTCDKLGIATVAVYSDADAKALHVRSCGEAVHIGASPATESYLRIDKIIAAAKQTGADAIHPGYGFLSENADLPEACVKAGLIFIGPSASAMRALGGKAAAKDIAIKAGVPVVPGYQGAAQDVRTLAKEAARIGYPVMIKAVAGGGGRGMRLVEAEAQLPEFLESAQREAQSSFGNPNVLVEKVVQRPRHIEVQVFGDSHGNVVHLFERDCTLQRRNQKVIEEAPAPGMTAGLREKMCGAAVKRAKSVGYTGAGTVEFLVEGGALDETARWYFIEMNTRLQVEHPVTEEITGLDLVEWQLRIAAGEKLPLAQPQIKMSGHAIEVRLCAEDPAKGFLPSVGKIEAFDINDRGAARIETGVEPGDSISPYYDSMIAKLIAHTSDRSEALDLLSETLIMSQIPGVRTNQNFLSRLMDHPDVRETRMDTGLIGRSLETLTSRPAATEIGGALAASWLDRQRSLFSAPDVDAKLNWTSGDAFQLGAMRKQRLRIEVDGEATDFDIAYKMADTVDVAGMKPRSQLDHRSYCEFASDASTLYVIVDGHQFVMRRPTYDPADLDDGAASGSIKAPINGRVSKLFVTMGQQVTKGDKIAVIEAMKMEHVLAAPADGTVDKLAVSEGAQIAQGALIAHVASGSQS